MAQRLPVLYNKKPCYDIVFQQSFDGLWEELQELGASEKKLCIVTDSRVDELYGAQVAELLEGKCRKIVKYAFPAGEENKNLETVKDVYRYLIEEGFDRKDMLLALGGGVTGDLTGFVAATYLRGIDFVQIPTTLLAQVDSSIGGKTGVDFDSYKNMVGAFKMPRLVYMNLSVLKTLEERQFYSGFAEVMKSALIKDALFYEWLIENMYEICEREPATLEEMVIRTCSIKKMVVEKDPTEQGDRALLNLGHTIGHAIEKYKNFELYHGECVALGTVAAAYISWKKEMLSMEEFYEIRDMFVPFYLPISVDDIDPQEILKLTKSDKRWKPVRLNLFYLKRSVRQSLTEPLQMTRFWLRSKKSILVKRMPMNKEKKSRIIMLLIDVLIAAILLVFDQFTKHLAVVHLKGQAPYVLIDGVLELQYLENRGSAFGMLQNQKVFILFVGIVFLAVLLFFLLKLPEQKKFRIVHILLAVIIAGGIGNMIDRFRLDYVVDFISFVLINYPIFNVADIYVVVATIGLFILFLFVYKEKDLEFLNFKQNRYREMK